MRVVKWFASKVFIAVSFFVVTLFTLNIEKLMEQEKLHELYKNCPFSWSKCQEGDVINWLSFMFESFWFGFAIGALVFALWDPLKKVISNEKKFPEDNFSETVSKLRDDEVSDLEIDISRIAAAEIASLSGKKFHGVTFKNGNLLINGSHLNLTKQYLKCNAVAVDRGNIAFSNKSVLALNHCLFDQCSFNGVTFYSTQELVEELPQNVGKFGI